MKNIVIIGNGIAGITAARHIRKNSDYEITVISSESKYFFSRTALMYVYMGHMRFADTQPYEPYFWEKNRIALKQAKVEQIETDNQVIILDSGEKISYDKLILATGSRPAFYNWSGQELTGVQGMYSKQDLENLESLSPRIKRAAIVGGGLIGIELAEMLLSRGIEVDFLVRENLFWKNILPENDAKFIMRHFDKHHGLRFHYCGELEEIKGNSEGFVQGIITKSGEEIQCEFVGITTGVIPNKELALAAGLTTNRGIVVNELLETSIPNIYAIGDCAEHQHPQPGRAPVEQVWYTGRIMGETVAQTITGNPTPYQPGIWFNSAKFFDIEYQTYGTVPNVPREGVKIFEWEHETEDIRLNFTSDSETKAILGVNTFGVRLRHELFDQWIREKQSLEYVLTNLSAANFDPEFYRTYEKNIINHYNSTHNTSLQLNKKVWWRNLLAQ